MEQPTLRALDGGPPLRLWTGVECTINRVGDRFRHQLEETGHASREGDIDLIVALNGDAVRYPILWEQIAPDRPEQRDWTWHDRRLGRLHAAGQRVIGGLLHHGSGPRYTNLLDPGFAAGLAAHAGAVAERYRFIEDWTPINEPVTTARFSALYGHWYPHLRDERAFWLALLNQIDATRLSMRAIRAINPAARLIQTDDLGRTYATAALRDQAAFDNVRRWMGWDLLCGRVGPGHDLWARLCEFGFQRRLEEIVADPCPPSIVGINHYLTSDRFLDHRRRRYAGAADRGGEARYVDTEAIRVLEPAPQGLAGSVREAWDRYRLPIAITEVHNGCTREEQMRWMTAAWEVAQAARARDIDVRAVASWALFGSSGWDTLLTGPGRYEAGAFDVSGGSPRATALVPVLQALGRGTTPHHPVLEGDGWWRRPIRLNQPSTPRAATAAERHGATRARPSAARPILIAGGEGMLGRAIAAACRQRGIAHVALGRAELDLLDEASVAAAMDDHQPWAVVNATGWRRIDEAEEHADACMAINADGAERLAMAGAARGVPTVHLSSDLVFDGARGTTYAEGDRPSPVNAYGRSKAAAEERILACAGSHLVVRTAACFSPSDNRSFAVRACRALQRGERFAASDEHVVSPTYVPDLCNALLDLTIDGETGIWHLTNGEACSWAEFARRLAAALGLDAGLVVASDMAALGWHARRPRHVPLVSRRGVLMPSLVDAIGRFGRDLARDAPSTRPLARGETWRCG